MNTTECDITTYALLDAESVGMTFSHIASLCHFRDNVVIPSIRALSEKIDEIEGSEEPEAVFLIGDLKELKRKTIEGYIIAIQSMWERGLRGMLANCELRLCNGNALEMLKTAPWSGKLGNLKEQFQRLMGISIQSFGSYEDLDFLQALGNAIRHGDGNSARRVYKLSPSLWPVWSHSVQDALLGLPVRDREDVTPSFDLIELSPEVLAQMIQSVLWFWEDVENVRCNSFKRKHDSVIRKLSTWTAEIARRNSERAWNMS
jgi:hypothetical protein